MKRAERFAPVACAVLAGVLLAAAVPSDAEVLVADGSAPVASAPEFASLAMKCAPDVHPALLGRVATVESSGNPFAIGVVHGHLERQPRNLPEALATVKALDDGGWNYSMGLVQVNVHNLAQYGQTVTGIFEPCSNLRTGAAILKACYERARGRAMTDAVMAALSCYYSGDLTRGSAYAMKVAAAAPASEVHDATPIGIVPDVGASGTAGGGGLRPSVKSGRSRKRTDPGDWFMTYGDDDENAPVRPARAPDNVKGAGQ